MNENIDLTKILEGCPQGTEFYHIEYGRVWLVCIDLDSDYPIRLSTNDEYYANIFLTKKGTINILYDGECILFPSKDQRNWSKFERFWDETKKEKFDITTLHPFDKMLTRDGSAYRWTPDFFGYIDNKKIMCVSSYWEQCIPYNEETKYLLGTTEDCMEYYKWWEE